MPVWLEVIVAWAILGTVVHLGLYLVGRKKGYFRWIDETYTRSLYNKGYLDAKKEMDNSTTVDQESSSFHPRVREYGIKDNRYK